MLEVKVEIVPWGMESKRYSLTHLYIGNDGTGTRETGNYDVYTEDPRGKDYPREGRPGYVGHLEGVTRTKGRDFLAQEALELYRNSAVYNYEWTSDEPQPNT